MKKRQSWKRCQASPMSNLHLTTENTRTREGEWLLPGHTTGYVHSSASWLPVSRAFGSTRMTWVSGAGAGTGGVLAGNSRTKAETVTGQTSSEMDCHWKWVTVKWQQYKQLESGWLWLALAQSLSWWNISRVGMGWAASLAGRGKDSGAQRQASGGPEVGDHSRWWANQKHVGRNSGNWAL